MVRGAFFGAGIAMATACAGAKAPVAANVAIPLRTESFVLPNGMAVILDEDHRAPVVSLNVSYRVGGRDDPPHRSGFAHLFEHLMFRGSKHVEDGDHMRLLLDAGARDINAETSLDRTTYYETLPSSELELGLWLESDRMGFLLDRLDDASLAKERSVVKNERRQRFETVPIGLVDGFLQAELYPAPHPYNARTIGEPDDLDRAALDDVRAYFRGHYMPSNATLAIVGDIDPKAAQALVTKYFGSLPSAPPPERVKPVAAAPRGEVRIRVEANVDEPHLVVSWRTPPILTGEDAALDVFIGMLGGGQGSLLYEWLVDERHLARNVSVRYAAWQLGGLATIDVSMTAAASFDDVLGVIDTALSDSPYARISIDSVNNAKSHEAASLIFSAETFTERAERYAAYRELTGSPVFLAKHIQLHYDVRSGDIPMLKETVLTADRRAIAFVTPSALAPVGGRVAGGLR